MIQLRPTATIAVIAPTRTGCSEMNFGSKSSLIIVTIPKQIIIAIMLIISFMVDDLNEGLKIILNIALCG